MEVDSYSRTAVMVAMVRAYHSAEPEPRIFDDPLANALLTRAEHDIFPKMAAEGLRRLDPALAETCSEASFFACPGLTMYLTRNAVRKTLRAIRSAAPAGSELVFDYLEPRAFAADAPLRIRVMVERVGQLGEPMLSGLDPAMLDSELLSV